MIQPQEKVNLQPYNTLSVPAQAEYFFTARTVEDIQLALVWAKECSLEVMVLSGGSNIVLQHDVKGLCLHIGLKGTEFKVVDEEWIDVTVAAGENWHEFILHCLQHQAYGLENLALIPGYAGAAPVQNIGAYGVEVKDYLLSLDAVNRKTNQIVTFEQKDCQFGYRESLFKSSCRDQYVITSVTYRLKRKPEINLSYITLAQELVNLPSPTPIDVFNAVVRIRSAKLPDPAVIANAGSFFKNPVVTIEQYQSLKLDHPGLVAYPDSQGMKLAAGWLIDKAGWKGKQLEGVGVHQQQALVITNSGQCEGSKVIELAEYIQEDIKQKYGVNLEVEPRVY